MCIRQDQKNDVENTARVPPGEHRENHQRPVREGRFPRSLRSRERRLDGTTSIPLSVQRTTRMGTRSNQIVAHIWNILMVNLV